MDSQVGRDTESNEALSQTLCRGCGLCCDGTLFMFARLSADDDIDELKKIGITTIREDEGIFMLPCKSFDRICTIYHTRRAKICGTYLCKLLKKYERGVIPLDRAAEIISQTKAHGEKTRVSFLAVLGDTAEGSLGLKYQSILASQGELKSAERNLAKLNYVALQVQIDRFFKTIK